MKKKSAEQELRKVQKEMDDRGAVRGGERGKRKRKTEKIGAEGKELESYVQIMIEV